MLELQLLCYSVAKMKRTARVSTFSVAEVVNILKNETDSDGSDDSASNDEDHVSLGDSEHSDVETAVHENTTVTSAPVSDVVTVQSTRASCRGRGGRGRGLGRGRGRRGDSTGKETVEEAAAQPLFGKDNVDNFTWHADPPNTGHRREQYIIHQV